MIMRFSCLTFKVTIDLIYVYIDNEMKSIKQKGIASLLLLSECPSAKALI